MDAARVTPLPTDAAARKATPIARGFLDYFPLAIAAVARCSLAASEQHNPGEPMRWSKEKSSDHADCLLRHLIERGTMDGDGIPHSVKVAWRAMALLQIELERAAVPTTTFAPVVSYRGQKTPAPKPDRPWRTKGPALATPPCPSDYHVWCDDTDTWVLPASPSCPLAPPKNPKQVPE